MTAGRSLHQARQQVTDNSGPMLESALRYVARGWFIFPIKPGKKKPPLVKWRDESSKDPDQIEKWWTETPDANIGLDCWKSGIVIIDIDDKDERDGSYNWAELTSKLEINIATPTVITGTGGQHLYFRAPKDRKIKTGSDVLASGIDVRAWGGYALLPPSIHPNGRCYEWEVTHHIDYPMMELPEPLLQRLPRAEESRPRVSETAKIPKGQRNVRLASQAGRLRHMGFSEDGIRAALQAENIEYCEPPLPENEVDGIAKSISRYPSGPIPEKPVVKYITNRDMLSSLFGKVVDIIRPTDRFFTYGNSIVYVEPGIGVIHMDTENLNGYLLKYLEIKNVSATNNNVERLLNYQVIARNHLSMFLSSPEIKEALPKLDSYSRLPIFDANWNLVSQPGYHPEQKVFYDGPIIDPRYETITIDEMLRDVHWKGQADRANYISVILTGLTIGRWIGTHPLVALNANKSQAGKSTLARIIGIILGGCVPSSIGYTSNQAEFEKAIATGVKNGGPIIFIDNAKGSTTSAVVNSPVLERCITDRILNFRLLGANKTITRRNDVIFITTMNDSKFSRDLQNRDIPINLEVFERIQDVEYSIPDPDKWVLEHRLDIISEALGMICRWVDLRCPIDSQVNHTVGPEWAKTTDSILRTNGITGFLENYEESNREYDADYDLIVEICNLASGDDLKSAGEWADRFSSDLLKEKLSDRKGNLRSERSRVVTVGKLFGSYVGEKIICESGDYTIEKKQVQSRPQKFAYRFKKLEKSGYDHAIQ